MDNFVSIKSIDNYNLENVRATMSDLFASVDAGKLFKPNMKVLIKVNAGIDADPDLGLTTHPTVVQALVDLISKTGATCIVADSPVKQYSLNYLEKVYFDTGMLEVANSTKCQLNHDLSTTQIKIPAGVKTKFTTVLNVAESVDAIVVVGKVNVDEHLGFQAVSQGLFGLIPGEMKNLFLNRLTTIADYNEYCLDLYKYFKNKLVLNVLDGVVAVETNQSQRMLSCLAMSKNMFSLEAVANAIVGRNFNETILKTAETRGEIDLSNAYKLVDGRIENFALTDFDFGEIVNNSNIHKSKQSKKQYFRHNQQRLIIEPNKCKGCARCAKICPVGAITMKYDKMGELYAKIDYDKCIFCNKCFTACPYEIIKQKTPLGFKIITGSINKYNEE